MTGSYLSLMLSLTFLSKRRGVVRRRSKLTGPFQVSTPVVVKSQCVLSRIKRKKTEKLNDFYVEVYVPWMFRLPVSNTTEKHLKQPKRSRWSPNQTKLVKSVFFDGLLKGFLALVH